ncbi:hypothetical protein C1645_740535 [Glomus cerebriforme]|uniref:Jacalin-type lectin domain-containing protein n=1 Tax=Glomus cerebriforme TaxID=658196 RepID=A0A397SL31_9GLOM|nr:hypothetical protein C1645_740535 [Glomus cerebriforme]
MTIIVKSVSSKYGGNGGTYHNDFDDIINEYGGGSDIIENIYIKSIIIQSGDTVNSLQFTYDIKITDLVSVYTQSGEKLAEISGRYGNFTTTNITVIRYLEFRTSRRTVTCGQNNAEDIQFTLPVGVIYGSSGLYLDSIGSYEISYSPLVIILSCFISILGFCFFIAMVTFLANKLVIRFGIHFFGFPRFEENFEKVEILPPSSKKEKNKEKNKDAEEEI